MKILITRPQPDADRLAALCRGAGMDPVQLPLLDIRFLPQGPSAIQPHRDDRLIFVSKNAVCGYPYPASRNLCFAVGQSTARALEQKGFTEIIDPHPAQGAEALLALAPLQQVTGQRFIVVRGSDSPELIETALAERGAEIVRLITYANECRSLMATEIPLLQANYDFMVITSSSALRYLAQLATEHNPRLFDTPVSTLTGTMLESVIHLGFTRPVIVNSFANKDLYESLRYRTSGTHPRQ